MIRALQDTFTINLTKGKQVFVDERDWRVLREFKWCAEWDPRARTFYAARGETKSEAMSAGREYNRRNTRKIYMHRQILGLKRGDGKHVDHENHNGLDNRRRNLRICTNRGNQENRRDQSQHGVGVKKDNRPLRRPFQAVIQIAGKRHYIGMFATAEEAQAAREKFLKEL